MAGLGGFALYQLSRVYSQTESILTYRLPGVRDGLRMGAAATYYRQREFRLLLTDAAGVPEVVKRIELSKAAVEAASKSYAAAIADGEERRLYDDAMAGWNNYLALSQESHRPVRRRPARRGARHPVGARGHPAFQRGAGPLREAQ